VCKPHRKLINSTNVHNVTDDMMNEEEDNAEDFLDATIDMHKNSS
jgi:hypothetical protein